MIETESLENVAWNVPPQGQSQEPGLLTLHMINIDVTQNALASSPKPNHCTIMLDELHTASDILKSALERYLNACLAITNQYELGSTLDGFSKAIINELQQTASYETKINESKTILKRVRNRRSDLVPISSLPPELLTHIFCLACKMEPCFLSNTTALSNYPSRPPESLLHVCSHWRSVALASPILWTHIDIAPYHMRNRDILTHGNLFAANSGEAPLDVHVRMIGGTTQCHIKQDLLQHCASVAARAKSLLLWPSDDLGEQEIQVIEKLFSNFVPGKLTRFTIRSHNDDDTYLQGFIVANGAERSPGDDGWLLDISHQHFEEVLRYITILRLDGAYPYWTSQAYHGLVKLHLTDTLGSFITVSQLAGILSASPQLRFLYFGFAITKGQVLPPPVYLDDLEVFHLDVEETPERDSILRMIYPGSKPLRMSIALADHENTSLADSEYGRFFARSKVAHLRVDSPSGDASFPLPELLALVPNLCALSLDGVDLNHACRGSSDPGSDKEPVGSQLTKLHLRYSIVNAEVLRWMIKTYPIQRITIDEESCSVLSDEDAKVRGVETCKNELLEICHAVEFVSDIDPVYEEDWN